MTELGSPSVSLRKALLALAAAFLRKIGCSLSVDLRFKVRLPATGIGAKCFSVVSLHANGREDSLEFKEFLAHLYRQTRIIRTRPKRRVFGVFSFVVFIR